MSRPFSFLLRLLCHPHYQLLHFPTGLLPGEVAFRSRTLPTDVFLSDLFILESPGCITLASSKELPILLRSIWETIALLDPSAGAYGEHFSLSLIHHLPLAGVPRSGPPSGCLSSILGFGGSQHLLPSSVLEKHLRPRKTLGKKYARTVEKIRVHQCENTECHHGNTKRQPPKWKSLRHCFPLCPAALVRQLSIPLPSERRFLKP